MRWLSKATVLPGDGLFHELFLGKPAALCKRLRLGLAEQVENSLLVRLWTGFVRHLLALDMVSWGGGLLAFGITLLGVTGLRALQGEIESFYGVQAAFAAASVLGGFLCATCREPLGEMLLDERRFALAAGGFYRGAQVRRCRSAGRSTASSSRWRQASFWGCSR